MNPEDRADSVVCENNQEKHGHGWKEQGHCAFGKGQCGCVRVSTQWPEEWEHMNFVIFKMYAQESWSLAGPSALMSKAKVERWVYPAVVTED